MKDSPPNVDMSPEAIDRRLRELGQLYRLWLSLRDATILGPFDETRDPARTTDTGD